MSNKASLKIGDMEIPLENVEILNLTGDDVLVVHVDDPSLRRSDAETIQAAFQQILKGEVNVIVLPKGFALEAVRQDTIPASTLQAEKKYRLTSRHGFIEMEEYDVRQ